MKICYLFNRKTFSYARVREYVSIFESIYFCIMKANETEVWEMEFYLISRSNVNKKNTGGVCRGKLLFHFYEEI